MIGVLVTFQYGNEFDGAKIQQIADAAQGRFQGLPGLRSKAFTIDTTKRAAINFYVWDSEEAARAFFTQAVLERVTGLYGVQPNVQFVQIAALVDNAE
ncbi:MAG: hypothetical protein JWM78_2249 [Verrucomicrobiaceae bacterium]|nr:hypothetical protein [Verrucomicrobiaceae bacterium]